MTTTDTEQAEPTTAEPSERLCDACMEPGTTDALPMHGECLLRQTFGGVATVLTPEDVGTVTDQDGGLTPRQSGYAIEMLIYHTTADRVLRREVVTDDLDERRKVLAYIKAIVTDNADELEKLDPAGARNLRLRRALRDVVAAVTGDV